VSASLIINSDDYGHTAEVSRGIREAHLRGVVTSTTCMMNHPTAAQDIRLALGETPRLGLGVHLVLTAEKPILPQQQVASITDEQGEFLKLNFLTDRIRAINVHEVTSEWRAQIEAFIQAAGRKPTHLDSHHHTSYFSADLFRGMLELAKEYDCAIRSPLTYDESMGHVPDQSAAFREYAPALMREFNPRRPDALFVSFYDKGATSRELLRIIQLIDHGSYEVMCHPGYVDEGLLASSTYNHQRERELLILTDPEIKSAVSARGIKLISFADL
jgi:chitin disaccharide deacetylase